jgi:hypothetical protein
MESMLVGHVASESVLIWTEPALHPVGLNRELLFFPASPARLWNVFGVGPQGQMTAPWIAHGYAYEFRLHRQDDDAEVELSAVTVIADRADPGPTVVTDQTPSSDRPEGAFLVAVPNPAKPQGTHASMQVSWSTGDGSARAVLVASYPFEGGMPRNDEEAIAVLERLRGDGGEFMFFSEACLPWLEHYAGLERYLAERYAVVIEDPSRRSTLRPPRMTSESPGPARAAGTRESPACWRRRSRLGVSMSVYNPSRPACLFNRMPDRRSSERSCPGTREP